jgi:class 3 adenylate cyclase/tetratricopeptide (TPR) repeat protein
VTSRSCPACAQPVGATAKFCAECGTPLTPAAPATEVATSGERRHITILFCDLVGSTALSEQLDPEELGDAVLAYQEFCRAVVTDLGGHVAQYLGDGLLAYFGYPVAHEDDADRAVLAGLAILDGISEVSRRAFPDGHATLEARVGIHAGPTVVGAMGSADRSDTSAFGSTPNIAARLEAFATPGTVVVSDEVHRRLKNRFSTVDRGTPELKGISRPIRAWEVTGVIEGNPATRTAPTTEMIGRDGELRHLLGLVDAARAGTPSHVVVSAEPGVGKSRLLQALHDHLAASAEPAVWLEGQCSELTTSSPLAPVIAFIRRTLGFDTTDDPDERRDRLVDALAAVGDDAALAVDLIGELLGVPVPAVPDGAGRPDTGPEARRRRTLDMLVAWVTALAEHQLVVLAVEDLHWADPSTLELLGMVAEMPAGTRLLTLHTSRPAGMPDLGREVAALELGTLSPDEAETLARALGATLGLAPDEVDAVAHRSDGVPLFIEELVRATTDAGLAAGDGAVPTTLQALFAARLDALGPARSVAQAASVLGREFPEELLAAIVSPTDDELPRHLDALRAAGLFSTRRTPAGIAHSFRHALIQDAAYASLLRRQRRQLHGAVAEALTTRFAHTVTDAPEVVASHLARAGAALDAGAWFERAGRRAAGRAAYVEARTHFEEGIAALAEADVSEERQRLSLSLHVLLANVMMGSAGIGHETVLPVWHRAVELAEEVDDDDLLTAALNGLAVYHFDRGDMPEAERYASWVVRVGESTDSRISTLRGHGSMGLLRLYQGRAPEALDHIRTAHALSRPGDFQLVTFGLGHDEETFFHTIASWAQWWVGRPDEGLATAQRGLACAQAIPSSLSQAMGRYGVAMLHHLRGEAEDAARLARENLTFAQALGFPFWVGTAQLLLGLQLTRLGDHAGADLVTEAMDRLAATGNLSGGSVGMAMMSEAYLNCGRDQEALDAADIGVAAGGMVDQPFCDTQLIALRGRALLALGRRDEGVEVLERSLEHGTRTGAASATLRTASVLAPLVAERDAERARRMLADALAAMHDGEGTVDQRLARAQLDELSVHA